jgi:hypothetical protein
MDTITLKSRIQSQCKIIFILTSILILYKYLELFYHLVIGQIIGSKDNSGFIFLYFLSLINISTLSNFIPKIPNTKYYLERISFNMMIWYLIILSISIFMITIQGYSSFFDNLSIKFLLYFFYFGIHPCLVWVVVSKTKFTTDD